MRSVIRKNGLSLDHGIAEEIFGRLETRPNLPQSRRVAHILELLSRLGENNRDFFVFRQLGQPLKRYKWHYGLVLGKELNARLQFTDEMSKANEWEHNAVRFLLSLVPHNLSRLKRCTFCNRWLFAEKRWDQKFCKRGACRQNHYDNDPSRKEHKRELMRENRKLHQKKNSKWKKR
jgi:hypothetical protein